MHPPRVSLGLVSILAGIFALFSLLQPVHAASGLESINHLIVIYQENWSFDALYGNFPGANGIANANNAAAQLDKNGKPYTTLPAVPKAGTNPPEPDPRIPADLPNAPYNLAKYVAPDQSIGSPLHAFYQNQYQIANGKNDKFVAWSNVGGLPLSYYDATDMPAGQLARQFTLADNWFQAAYGGSFLNHFWLVCACTPLWRNAPPDRIVQLDTNGLLVKDNSVTPDGYAVNTSYSVNSPHPASITQTAQLLPVQTMPTIGDRLNEQNVSWAWFSGGWNDASAGKPDKSFQFHHQPFAFFANYADNTPGRIAHLKDEADFLQALTSNNLPSVSFVKPIGTDNEHPNTSTPLRGQQHAVDLVKAILDSPYWKDSLIVYTYDENGGRWDHVAPPAGDRWGPGTRVPAIFISPYAKKGFVDHTQYDTTSILKFIEARWNLQPLGTRDAAANDFRGALEFPNEPQPLQLLLLALLVAIALLLLARAYAVRRR